MKILSIFRSRSLFHLLTIVLAALALTLSAAACGDDDDPDDKKDSNTAPGPGGDPGTNPGGNGGTTTETAYCCLNGNFFNCGTADASKACFDNAEPGSCVSDPSRNSECDWGGGREPEPSEPDPGEQPEPELAEVGEQCQTNGECETNACLTAGDFGYCTQICTSWADCPPFWECEPVDNSSAKYCYAN